MKKRRVVASLAAAGMVVSLLGTTQPTMAQAATKLKVSVSKCVLKVGQTKTVSANKKVTWKSSDKKVATVKKVNGKKAKIVAKKKGTCKVTANIGKKKVVIKVTIQKAKTKPTVTPTMTPETVTNGSVTSNSAVNPGGTPSTDTQMYMNETGGVSISLSGVKTTNGTLTIQNHSGNEVCFGLDYSIQKYENGQWTALTMNSAVSIPAIAILVLDGKTYTENLNWGVAFGSLSQGTYRVVKQISVSGQNKTIASQFVIDENTEVGVTSVPTVTDAAGTVTGSPAVATVKPEVTAGPVTHPQTPDPAYSGTLHTLSPEEKEKLEHAIPADNMPVITENPTTSQETPQTDSQVYMDEAYGASIQLSDIKTTGATFTITNNAGNDMLFLGLDYSIEKYEDGQWSTLTSNPVMVPDIGLAVENGKSYTGKLDWAASYGSLPQGTYRLVKQVSVYGKGNMRIASQFVIDENTEIGTTSVPTVTDAAGTATAEPIVVTARPAGTPAVATAVPSEITTPPFATPVPVQNVGE